MNADFPVVLDACVLANQQVTDLLLRLAETRSGMQQGFHRLTGTAP